MTHTDEVVEKPDFHMLGLAKSECAKDAGELTVVRLGYVTTLQEQAYEAGYRAAQSAKVEEMRGQVEKMSRYICQHTPEDSCDSKCMHQEYDYEYNLAIDEILSLLSPTPAEVTSEDK